MWCFISIMFFQPLKRKKKKLVSSVSYQLSPKSYAARSANWVSFWESPRSLSETGATVLSPRWELTGMYCLAPESSRSCFCETAPGQITTDPHRRAETCMFSNSSWWDEITEGDAEHFWMWHSGENKRPYASFTTWKGLKSLTKEREGKSS